MEHKDISEEYVQLTNLSITNLLQCITANGVKQQFVDDIGPEKYSKIVKDMRSESTIIGMRDFHNWIKLVFLSNVSKYIGGYSHALLDIAVGRGGDLAKWNKTNVRYVFGFDKNEKSITNDDPADPGALARLATFKGSKFKDIEFSVGNALKPSKELLTKIDNFLKRDRLNGFNIVSCQFALHYFFKEEIDLRITLTLISKYLNDGGVFLGTTINGESIKNLFKTTSEKVYNTSLFRVQRKFPKTLKAIYGNEYTFTIFDTKDSTNYFNTMGLSTEYLVNFKALEEMAATVGLKPLNLNFFEEYPLPDKRKGFVEIKKNIVPFNDILKLGKWTPKTGIDLTPEEKELNSLYTTFAFIKLN
jgi:mRNA (guanine-N7-)-methyltransferase